MGIPDEYGHVGTYICSNQCTGILYLIIPISSVVQKLTFPFLACYICLLRYISRSLFTVYKIKGPVGSVDLKV